MYLFTHSFIQSFHQPASQIRPPASQYLWLSYVEAQAVHFNRSWHSTKVRTNKFVHEWLPHKTVGRNRFLSAFAILRKTSVCPSVLPSFRPHGTTRYPLDGFSWNLIWEFFENPSRKFKFHWNLTRTTSILREDQYTFFIKSRSVLLRMRNVSDKFVEKIKTHILYSINFFSNIWPFIR